VTSAAGVRVLEPSERLSEILFGLIMVLTFTGALSAAESGRAEVRTMLIGAIGCNFAWGIIDAVFYLMNAFGHRGQGAAALRRLQGDVDAKTGNAMVADALPPLIASVLRPDELDSIRRRLAALPEQSRRRHLAREDYLGALGVFLLVFLSTFPVVIPFLVIPNAVRALRISNAVAIGLLFLGGYRLGKYAGYSPWRTGLAMVAIGIVLVAITIALGG
jgi:VIT family